MAENIDETSLKIMKATLVVLQREGSKATTKKIAAESGFNELTHRGISQNHIFRHIES